MEKNPEEIPLMDEVEEILRKERALMTLKVIEQQKQANEWKDRFDQLSKKIHEVAPHNDQVLELIVDLEQPSGQQWHTGLDEIPLIMKDSVSKYYLDFSKKPLGSKGLKQVLKGLFGIRKQFIPALLLRSCQLNDSVSEELTAIMSMNNIDAFDLSCNDIGPEFERDLIKTIQDRRKMPQYILLHGNIPLSHSKTLSAIIDTFSNRTWGISVTLQDFYTTKDEHEQEASQHNKTTKKTKNATNNHHHPFLQQPLLSLNFLSNLEALLSPLDNMKELRQDQQHGRQAKGSAGGSGVESRHVPSLSVLQMTSAQLSRQSIATLERVLQHCLGSLTDLDLTWALIGSTGAQMLSRIISSSRGCQLVRLGLQGNAVGDSGAQALANAMSKNDTLTSMDLRSNDLSPSALRSFCDLLTAADTRCCLAHLDLRANDISATHGLEAEHRLRITGCLVVLLWSSDQKHHMNDYSHTPSFLNTPRVWMRDLQRRKRKLSAKALGGGNVGSAEVLLYAVSAADLAHYYHERHEVAGATPRGVWIVEWNIRCLGLGIGRASVAIAVGKAGTRGLDVEVLGWELRVQESDGIALKEHLLDGGTMHSAIASSGDHGDENGWNECRVEIPADAVPVPVPYKVADGGVHVHRLELWAWAPREVNVETADFRVSTVEASGPLALLGPCGGDRGDWSEELNVRASAVAESPFDIGSFVPKGHVVLRHMELPSTRDFLRGQFLLSWEMRIGATASVVTPAVPQTSQGDYAHVSYSWRVSLLDCVGTMTVVAEDKWPPADAHAEDHGKLAWQWKRWELLLPVQSRVGKLIVSGGVQASEQHSDVISGCCIRLRQLHLCESRGSSVLPSKHPGWLLGPSSEAELYCVHNDPGLAVFF